VATEDFKSETSAALKKFIQAKLARRIRITTTTDLCSRMCLSACVYVIAEESDAGFNRVRQSSAFAG